MKRLVTLLFGLLVGLLFSSGVYALPIEGSSTGVFSSVVGPTTWVTGLGTSTLTTGQQADSVGRNSWSFTGQSFSTDTETIFKLGTLSYFNGTTFTGTDITGFDLTTALNFTIPDIGEVGS